MASVTFVRRTVRRSPLSAAGPENVARKRSNTTSTGTISRFTSTCPASSFEMSSRLSNSCSRESVHCRIWSTSAWLERPAELLRSAVANNPSECSG